MKKLKLSLIFLLTVPLFVGCGINEDNQATRGNKERDDNTPTQTTQRNERQDGNILTRNLGTNNEDNNRNNNQTRLEAADEAEDKVEDLEEVRHANVIVTNRNAYVAVVLDEQPKGEVRKEVEDKISDAVKSTDRDINNVFVSANPDFVDRMTDYGDKVASGRPIQGLFEEFNEMIQRVFPTAR